MTSETFIHLLLITGLAIASRIPFLRFPLDDDFSIYTYVPRFSDRGFQWKKDLWLLGKPIWTQRLLDQLYGNPETGPYRTRLLFMAFHILGTWAIYFSIAQLTGHALAGFGAGLLLAFYGSSPDYTAGNYHQEQFFLPLIFAGFALVQSGPEWIGLAGLLFGLAVIPKFTTGIYGIVIAGVVAITYGFSSALWFGAGLVLPILVSLGIDWKLGYWDDASREQYKTRWAVGIHLIGTKQKYFSVFSEVVRIMRQTLPVWILGLPGLFISLAGSQWLWMLAFSSTLIGMIVVQRGFSRYQYLPLVGLMCWTTGIAMDLFIQLNILWAAVGFLGIAGAFNLAEMIPFYLRPLDIKSLSQSEKFDQYIYVPYLARILKRRMRMDGELDRRIFVWGTFTQFYHYMNAPASDTFLHHGMGPWDSPAKEPYFDNIIGGLIEHKPVYIIKAFHDLKVEELEAFTGLKYKLIKVALGRFPIYRLVDHNPPKRNPVDLPWQEKMNQLAQLTEYDLGEDAHKTDSEGKAKPGINKLDIHQGRLSRAYREFYKLCRLNPYDTAGLYQFARLADRMEEMEIASKTFRHLIAIEPNWEQARLFLANQLAEQNRLNEAERWIREERQRFGNRIDIQFHLGRLNQRRGDHEKAVLCFNQVCVKAPEWVDVRSYLAESYEALGMQDQAIKAWEDMFGWIQDQPDADYLRAKAALGLAKLLSPGCPESETLEHWMQKDPQNEILAYSHASALEREGHAEKAKAAFLQYTQTFKRPNLKAAVWFRLARLSPPEQREPLLRECLRLDFSHSGARQALQDLQQHNDIATALTATTSS